MSWIGRLWKRIEPHIVQDDPHPPRLDLDKWPYIYLIPWPFKVEPRSIMKPAQKDEGQKRFNNLKDWLGSKTDDQYAICRHVCSSGIYVAVKNKTAALKLRLEYDTVAIKPENCVYIPWYVYQKGVIQKEAVTYPRDLYESVDSMPKNKYNV